MAKLTERQLLELIENPDIPETAIEPFLIPTEHPESAFSVRVAPNPDRVEIDRFEGGLEDLNKAARRRRERIFIRRTNAGDTSPVLVSEGDSWFQFPVLLKDTVDHLNRDYRVWSMGAAGDTVENMLTESPEWRQGLERNADTVSAFLLSAAGNDVIGRKKGGAVLKTLLHDGANGGRAEELVIRKELNKVISGLREAYSDVVSQIREAGRFDELPILFHGYDYALPFPVKGIDVRRPLHAKRDAWLGSALRDRNIKNEEVQQAIIRILIDALYDMLFELAATDTHVHVVDVRGTLPRAIHWNDEIHPRNRGFSRVADLFKAKLIEVGVGVQRRRRLFEGMASFAEAHVPDETQTPPLLLKNHAHDLDGRKMGFAHIEQFGNGFVASRRRFEALVGEDDSLPARYLSAGAYAMHAVCRIKVSGATDWKGRHGSWVGTGFLVAPNILLTNAHVLNDGAAAESATIEFGLDAGSDGMIGDTQHFELLPSRLFVASEPDDLDYAFCAVAGSPGERFGYIPFWRGSFMGNEAMSANIIHHPGGDPKRVSLRENEVTPSLGAAETLVHYMSDTARGSSGAPVLSDDWRLFALHHANYQLSPDQAEDVFGDASHEAVLNEGIKCSAIAADIELRARGGDGAASARLVLPLIRGIDSRNGFFGMAGRSIPATAQTGFERVVSSYRGANHDIDIAFWNIEWFVRDYRKKLDDVARVIADLNLDIYALQEASPKSTEALVRHLNQSYGQAFDFAVSEPDSEGKQTNTVIWNTLTVKGSQRDWPAAAAAILQLDSRDSAAARFEAVEGRLFNRYPGLFHFQSAHADGPAIDFNLVPLHLKAFDEGAKRRAMASKALAEAIALTDATGAFDSDWVLGGDMNAELSTGQFAGLTDRGFTALGAADEADGAITYLKGSHRSMIDHIFLSPNLHRLVGLDDFMVVASDKVYPDYLSDISDHRPVMVRLSASGALREETVDRFRGGEFRPGDLNEFLNALRASPADTLRRVADHLDE